MSNLPFRINDCYIPLLTDKSRYLVLFGGGGSGKSHFAAQKILLRLTSEEKHRFLVLRKVKNTIQSSVFQEFCDLIADNNLSYRFRINKTTFRITDIYNQNEIIFAGIDDPEKLKSIKGITGIWMEEATEFDKGDFDQLDLRLRGHTKNYKQIIISFNPIDEGHWLKAELFDKKSPKIKILKTTYLDNNFLDEEYLSVLNERIANDENLFRIYVKGEWGRMITGGNFYKKFLLSKNSGKTLYNPDLPIHLSFDFNVNPSVTATLWQFTNKKATCFDEISLKDPKNTTRDVCEAFKKKYFNHINGLFIYGDASGKNQDTRSEKGHNDYSIILDELTDFKSVLRVPSKNPSVAMRGQFINRLLEGNFEGVEIIIDEKCKNLLEDLQYLKENSEGGKHKQKGKNENGIICELLGHAGDSMDYVLCEFFVTEYRFFQTGRRSFHGVHGKDPSNSRFKF